MGVTAAEGNTRLKRRRSQPGMANRMVLNDFRLQSRKEKEREEKNLVTMINTGDQKTSTISEERGGLKPPPSPKHGMGSC